MKREPGPDLDLLAKEVIGAALEVHRALGPGFLESTYQKALEVEFRLRAIPAVAQQPVTLVYKGVSLGDGYLDFLVDERLIVELKAVDALAPIHKAQVISYLKATGLLLGLLINFNVPMLREGIKRVIYSSDTNPEGLAEENEGDEK